MASYKMRFNLGGEIYELVINAASSGSALRYVQRMHPEAGDVTIVG